MKKYEDLPRGLRHPEVKEYLEILQKKQGQLAVKRAFDVCMAFIMLLLLAVPMAVIAVMIAADSPGGVFFRQKRITTYGKVFRIHKFRTMCKDADKKGSAVTVSGDARVTKIGAFLRKYRLDELPQLIDVLAGDMSFVGTRPEVPEYVKKYTKEMRATLLLPAGITSEASIAYKDEAELLDGAADPDEVYVKQILPAKMEYNLKALREFSLWNDLKTMIRTVLEVIK
ncbi:MAG: sugar transferase [Lachnospiraceae bacterium]|nr:sugar transferase [Lachnospiraceae bacterium]MBR3734843.1 sugar transferase [Lachnospiraceae bacterium]MBR6851317.1 sugar transferase [Lachnospiraceae bacterium]